MEINEATCPTLNAYGIRTKDSMEAMGKYIMQLFKDMRKHKLHFAGTVFSVYYEKPVEGQPCDYEMAATVKESANNNMLVKTYGGGKALHMTVKGSYKNLAPAYNEMNAYIDKNKIEKIGPPIEIYTRGPILGMIMIPFLLVTDIYFPVK
jgi:effector-binding domain-containing protein